MKSPLFILLALMIISCNTPKKIQKSPNLSPSAIKDPIDKKVSALLNKMTLREKIGQMNQYSGFWEATGPTPDGGSAKEKYDQLANGMIGSMLNVTGAENVKGFQKIAVEKTRLGIPLIIGYDVIHGFKTIAPIPLAESASWDIDAIRSSARWAAIEATAAGINWTFAPMVDISREARWGRVMEGAGEDPYLGSKIAAARVEGFQGKDLSANNTLAACAKHFAGYGFPIAGREYNTVEISMPTLYNVVFPPFKAAVDAGVRTLMNGFHELNGIPATANSLLVNQTLKGDWKFDGFVVSDWASIGELVYHGYAADLKDAALKGIGAGSDMDMEAHAYINHLEELVKEGKVDERLIDDACGRILKVKYELGLFDDPYKYCDPEREKRITGSPEIKEAALKMAQKSMVLLKNEGLLPLKKSGLKIALIGDLAADKNSPLGSWRAKAAPQSAVSVLEGMLQYKDNDLQYSLGVDVFDDDAEFVREVKVNTTNRKGMNEAVRIAKNADVVVMVLGEHGFQSGEGRSRTSIGLPGLQQELLEKIYDANKNIVLVLMNGRPLAIPWAASHVPSILEAWHLGTQSGHAIAQALYGDVNPSGKLPVSFPYHVGQVPIYYNMKSTGRWKRPEDMVFWSHYIDAPNTPLYPFGYGLSYTTFKYDNLRVSSPSFSKGGHIKVSIDITNTGDLAGEEIVQLYIRDKVASITRPVKELKGFDKISLRPGQSKTVTFTINEKSIRFHNGHHWVTEPGEFDLWIGKDSADNTLHSTFSYE